MDRGAWQVQSMGSQRVKLDWATKHCTVWKYYWSASCVLGTVPGAQYRSEGNKDTNSCPHQQCWLWCLRRLYNKAKSASSGHWEGDTERILEVREWAFQKVRTTRATPVQPALGGSLWKEWEGGQCCWVSSQKGAMVWMSVIPHSPYVKILTSKEEVISQKGSQGIEVKPNESHSVMSSSLRLHGP